MGLHLSKENWQEEIAASSLPESLKDLVRSLVTGAFSCSIPLVALEPVAEPLISLVREHLQDTIWIGYLCFNVMIFVPKDKEKRRSVFMLIPSYPDGKLMRPAEI